MDNNHVAGQRQVKHTIFSHVKNDLPAGLVVFLIALLLCLGISLASGAPLFSGIIAGIVGGIMVGLLSGSHINVSGPAPSVALVVLTAINSLGSFEVVMSATIIAGIFQIILGFVRAGTIAYFFPSSMIRGILASNGLILIINQIPHAFGYAGKKLFGSMEDGFSTNIFSDIIGVVNYIHPGATLITLLSLAIIFLWDRPSLKKYTFFKFVSAALIAVLTSIGINSLFAAYFPNLSLSGERLVQLPVASGLGNFSLSLLFRISPSSQIRNYIMLP
jgi:MFS superfamily sulfate permease-like transporter